MRPSTPFRPLLPITLIIFTHLSSGAVAADAEYVGMNKCAGCHQEQVSAWQGSHHDLAMQEATADTVLGDFDNATFNYFGNTSRFFRKDGAYYVNTDGADGEPADFEIKYAFGVEPLQQYLIAFDDGRLQALPIAWDTRPRAEGGQKWFHLYPNEEIRHGDPLHWTGPNQNWNFMCAECHSTNLKRNYDKSSNSYNTTWSEINVACEACHGPGIQHVRWAKENGEHKDGLGLQVDLSRSGAWTMNQSTGIAQNNSSRESAQTETCARCHARRIALSEDYQHGRPLINTYRPRVLLQNLYYADGQIQDEVYVYGSFLQSKMYASGVVCSDCHDPHSLQLKAEGNRLCASCHLPANFDTPQHHFHKPGSAAAQCVNCHMPARLYMVHDARRDHSFRVPRPDLSERVDAPDVCTDCHQGRSAQWAAGVIEERSGGTSVRPPHFGVAIDAGRRGSLDAESRLNELVNNNAYPAIARATGATLLGGYLSPLTIQTLANLLKDEDPLIRVNALSALEGLDPRLKVQLAAELLDDAERAVRIEAANLLADAPGDLLNKEQRSAFGKAIDDYIEVQENNADRAESWTNLGNLYLRLGSAAKAIDQYQHAIELDPGYTPAYANLADLHRSEQRDADAERVLQQAMARMPDAASLHHAYGLMLVRQRKLDQAVEELKRAVEIEPGNVRFRYVYAVGLSSIGDNNGAITELELANEIRPVDRDVLIALINFHQQMGNLDRARYYAENLVKSAPWNRDAQALLQRLSD